MAISTRRRGPRAPGREDTNGIEGKSDALELRAALPLEVERALVYTPFSEMWALPIIGHERDTGAADAFKRGRASQEKSQAKARKKLGFKPWSESGRGRKPEPKHYEDE